MKKYNDTIAANYGEELIPAGMTRGSYEQKEREALMERIKAMDEKQLEIVAECIPVDICLRRVNKEYGQLKAFADTIKNTIGNF